MRRNAYPVIASANVAIGVLMLGTPAQADIQRRERDGERQQPKADIGAAPADALDRPLGELRHDEGAEPDTRIAIPRASPRRRSNQAEIAFA
jgi:hypothetical protein